jgi:hypothetical protein
MRTAAFAQGYGVPGRTVAFALASGAASRGSPRHGQSVQRRTQRIRPLADQRSEVARANPSAGESSGTRQIFNPLPIVRREVKFRGAHILLEMRE